MNWITPYSIPIGVAGAGTMGSGIALTALLADLPVSLYDVSSDMLQRARGYIDTQLERKRKQQNQILLTLTNRLEDLSGARVIIEAIPEDLGLKQDLFRHLDAICPPTVILATNTSTLAVTAIASATAHPQRVAGMHFFNPAPVMPLVELVRGAQTSEATLQALRSLTERLGKTPVVAADTPGFIVNRVARPFYGEALRLFGDGAATHEQIDRVVRLGGGFRMGPFELMDLIGIDINLSAMQSMYEQTFGEPRYRPHAIQVRMVQQNALGRKTGHGFYRYEEDRPPEPVPPQRQDCRGLVLYEAGTWVPGLPEVVRSAGYTLQEMAIFLPEDPLIAVVGSSRLGGLRQQLAVLEEWLPAEVPILCQCVDVTLTEISTWMRTPQRLVGFDGLFFASGHAATLVASPSLTPQARSIVEAFIASLGFLSVWIEDSPGLILPRIVCMLANEAAFALQEGVAGAEQIDQAMQLGVSYPRGPLTWARQIGYAHVLRVLEHLQREFGEDRYRPAHLLRRWARLAQRAN